MEKKDRTLTYVLLFLSFFILTFAFLFLIYFFRLLTSGVLPTQKPKEPLDEGKIACTEASVREAWLFRYPAKHGCPPWVNPVFVKQERFLYARTFRTSANCCWYDSDQVDLTDVKRIEFPSRLVGNTVGRIYTDQECNQTPYRVETYRIIDTCPVCNLVPEASLELRFTGEKMNLGQSSGQGGIYLCSNPAAVRQSSSDPDLLLQIQWVRFIFSSGETGSILEEIIDRGLTVIRRTSSSSGSRLTPVSQRPLLPLVSTVVEIDEKTGFQPLAAS